MTTLVIAFALLAAVSFVAGSTVASGIDIFRSLRAMDELQDEINED